MQGREPTVGHSGVQPCLSTADGKRGEDGETLNDCHLDAQGQTGVVEISCSRALPLELYSDYRALGRLALRDGGRTIAVGVVTQLLTFS